MKIKLFFVFLVIIASVLLLMLGCGQGQKASNEENSIILISPEAAALVVGDTQQFSCSLVTGSSTSGTNAAWSVIGSMGTIDATGFFTATAVGEGMIEASLDSLIGRARVTVTGGGRSFFPYVVGNSFRLSCNDGSSSISTIEGTARIGMDTVQIMKSTSISLSGNISTSESYFKVDDAGVYLYPSLDSTEAFTYLVFPLEIGKTWKMYDFPPYSVKVTVMANESITVPAGTFNCYKINFVSMSGSIETSTLSYWFGNGAGFVKSHLGSSADESVLVWKNF